MTTTVTKRAINALLPAAAQWMAEEEARRTDPDHMLKAFGIAMGEVLALAAARRVRHGIPPREPRMGTVSWVGPEGEARKGRLIELSMQGKDWREIARIMKLPPAAVRRAISKFVPKQFRPQTGKPEARAGRTADSPQRAVLPPAETPEEKAA